MLAAPAPLHAQDAIVAGYPDTCAVLLMQINIEYNIS